MILLPSKLVTLLNRNKQAYKQAYKQANKQTNETIDRYIDNCCLTPSQPRRSYQGGDQTKQENKGLGWHFYHDDAMTIKTELMLFIELDQPTNRNQPTNQPTECADLYDLRQKKIGNKQLKDISLRIFHQLTCSVSSGKQTFFIRFNIKEQ